MSKNFMHKIETHTREDSEGNITETKKETLTKIQRSEEPDYIKLYTKIWADFNGIPDAFQGLFLQLALRMTYANVAIKGGGQMVHTGEPTASEIMQILGWNSKDWYQKGLAALVKCNALKRLARGAYQINPSYAGKGEWKYNPRLQRGGIEDLIATFNFREKTIDTQIIWADDGKPTEFNEMYRQGLQVKAEQNTVLKTSTTTPLPDAPTIEPEAPTSHENSFDGILQGRFWNGKIYANSKVYLNNAEVLLSDEQAELLKTHEKYIA